MRCLTLVMVSWFFLNPYSALAAYTNENINELYHEAPLWFIEAADGSWFGETEGGLAFRQVPIQNVWQVRLHKFTIGSAFWYITDKGVITAETDLVALSIYLSLA